MPHNFRNQRYANAEKNLIDMELEHPIYGWIPIAINQEDYPELWEEVISASGLIAAPEAVPDYILRGEWRQTAKLTRAQFCLALKKLGVLPPQEAVAAAKGEWPASFQAALSEMPEGYDAQDVQILWGSITEIERLHPVFEVLREFKGMTSEQADALFGYPE